MLSQTESVTAIFWEPALTFVLSLDLARPHGHCQVSARMFLIRV